VSREEEPKKKRRIQNKGLWFGTMRADIQDVRSAHKKLCEMCGERPTGKRLRVTKGAGRHATTSVFCQQCGNDWINDFRDLLERAKVYLYGDDIESVRDPDA
jgi:DNA-directed RNA polymerase subunit M/transcription elongation factor TFIIS